MKKIKLVTQEMTINVCFIEESAKEGNEATPTAGNN